MTEVHAAYGVWLAFLLSWCVAMLWTARAMSRGDRGARIAYFAGYAIGFGLLFAGAGALAGRPEWDLAAGWIGGAWTAPLWRDPPAVGWALVASEVAAFLFAWWARLHLGRLWSGMMTLRDGHRVVDTGPYALVRHPIYTGLIGAAWALALIVATPTAIAGAIILTGVMAVKAIAEERLLRDALGRAVYDAYATRTPMIVPFAPR